MFKFNNIGRKIMKFAKVNTVIGIAIPILYLVYLIFVFVRGVIWGEPIILLDILGLPLAILLAIVIWIGQWLFYAFGSMVEDIHYIAEGIRQQKKGEKA